VDLVNGQINNLSAVPPACPSMLTRVSLL